ncbi:Metallophosphoesterase domain-containing protein 1 [Phytophthora citrophthora]|uniref:Metallophosphoesterase domain-containing protein 1 n=1 Tax=Phytophthora citrophthora TaxID=4793 RepID=A0AAD9G842_9STRA|nr:Metallophosphoesterase domain-containing protein 1 [Phytophthora citrophthora]
MKVVCVSDTHGLHEDALAIPDGDVFVHAGDFTDTGERSEVLAFNEFLGRLPHRYKLVIAGNHESSFDRVFYPQFWHQYGHRQQYEPDEVRALLTNALYLEDQAVLIEGFVFYGTPWQPEFCNWAFNLPRGNALLKKWRHIPSDTDVLISHTPPMGHGDLVGYQRVGCADLLKEVETRVRPKLHVFGHVHEGYGRSASPDGEITYFNASTCTHNYEPVNPPFVFELAGPPKRGWPKRTLPLPTPTQTNGLGMPRSFSTNDVSSISSLSTTEDEDVNMDGEISVEAEPRDYDLMLHEWLRHCSHKPPFIEKKLVEVETCEVRKELREFRVDGTTSGLLFQSTLKLRPVTNVQRRALRYLFSQGFRSNSENYKTEEAEDERIAAQDENGEEDAATGMQVDSESVKPARERRNYGISRRVTVAVLDDIDEDKEGMDDRDREHVQQARVAAAALCKDPSTEPADSSPGSRRPRRNKTLQRRSAVPKLASLTEEPSEEENKVSEQEKAGEQAAASEAIVVAPPVVECVLCKYKVPGHVHPGAVVTPPPAPVEPPKEKPQEKPSEQRSRAENPPPKRLSSWF